MKVSGVVPLIGDNHTLKLQVQFTLVNKYCTYVSVMTVFTWFNISISQILYDTQDKAGKNHLRHQEQVSGN